MKSYGDMVVWNGLCIV